MLLTRYIFCSYAVECGKNIRAELRKFPLPLLPEHDKGCHMPNSFFSHVKISAISVVVPEKEVRLIDELFYFNGDAKKAQRMTKVTGVDRRRIADSATTAADLCCQAAEHLFEGIGFDALARASIDALIFVSQQPDYFFPATACILQHRLGLATHCAAYDVNQGCSAYTYGLWQASALLESRAVRRVLLVVGDTPSKLAPEGNRIVAPIFGDGGSATLLEYAPELRPSWYTLGTDGSGYETLIVPGGAARMPLPADSATREEFCSALVDSAGNPWNLLRTYMDGGAIFDFTLSRVPETIGELLSHAQLTPEDITFLALHQANKQIVEAVTQKAGFPLHKVSTDCLSAYGNLAGCSIPGGLCRMTGQGAFPSGNILLSGFGVGLSWASAILSLEGAINIGIHNYKKPEKQMSQKTLQTYWQNKLSAKDME